MKLVLVSQPSLAAPDSVAGSHAQHVADQVVVLLAPGRRTGSPEVVDIRYRNRAWVADDFSTRPAAGDIAVYGIELEGAC